MARWGFFAVMIVSVVGFVALLILNGLDEIVAGLGAIGWGLAAVVAIRLTALACAGTAWRIALGRSLRLGLASGAIDPKAGSLGRLVGLRCIREAINSLLPAAQVGGDLLGGRLLARLGMPLGLAMASILVDILLQASTQGLFALTGLLALWRLVGNHPLVRELGSGLVLAVPALGGFFIAQRFGLLVLVERGVRTLKRWMPGIGGSAPPLDLQTWLKALYADWRALLLASLVHLAAWSTGIGEVWIALHYLGSIDDGHGGWAEALVLESLGQAVRSAAFAVPGALGIQEGGFILLGAVFGMPASQAVALSLVKRLPDLAIGIPGLVAWQAIEARLLRPVVAPAAKP